MTKSEESYKIRENEIERENLIFLIYDCFLIFKTSFGSTIIIEIFYRFLLFLTDIIDNIIYASGSCHQNSNQWQCSIIVTCLCLYHMTSILHCHWRGLWSRDRNISDRSWKVSFNSWNSPVADLMLLPIRFFFLVISVVFENHKHLISYSYFALKVNYN